MSVSISNWVWNTFKFYYCHFNFIVVIFIAIGNSFGVSKKSNNKKHIVNLIVPMFGGCVEVVWNVNPKIMWSLFINVWYASDTPVHSCFDFFISVIRIATAAAIFVIAWRWCFLYATHSILYAVMMLMMFVRAVGITVKVELI